MMRRIVYALVVIFFIGLTSCRKNSVQPSLNQNVGGQKTVAGNPDLNQGTGANADSALNNVSGYMRLQLTKDSINNDNIFINFNPAAKTTYYGMEDAPSFQGFGLVSLASYSSDNVPLAINVLPLTKQGIAIKLRVNASNDGVYKLDMLSIKTIPDAFDIWLMDNYKKDSLDLRTNHSYAFNIAKSDTASFGSNRFKLTVRKK